MEERTATRVERAPVRRIGILLAAGLPAAAVWAGASLAGGAGGSAGSGGEPTGTSDRSAPSFVQEDGDRKRNGRNCPERDGRSNAGGAADVSV